MWGFPPCTLCAIRYPYALCSILRVQALSEQQDEARKEAARLAEEAAAAKEAALAENRRRRLTLFQQRFVPKVAAAKFDASTFRKLYAMDGAAESAIARENEALARRLAGAKPAVSANRKPPPNRPMQRPRSFNGASPMGASLRNQRGPPPPRAMHDSGRMAIPAHFPPGPVHEPAPGSGMDYLLEAAEAAARG